MYCVALSVRAWYMCCGSVWLMVYSFMVKLEETDMRILNCCIA